MIDTILNSTHLPSPPTVAMQLLEHTQNPDATVADFVNAIKVDPAMSAKILKASNSSYFSFRSEITSLERAVSMIGRKPIAALVLGFSLVGSDSLSNAVLKFYKQYWQQAVVQGITAEFIAGRFHKGSESEAFLVGLLMDIGRLAMLKAIPSEYAEILNSLDTLVSDLHVWELQHFGFSHVDIGIKLLQKWEIPQALIDAMGTQHEDSASLNPESVKEWNDLSRIACFAANAGDCFCTQGKGRAWQRLKHLAETFYNLNEQQLESLLVELKDRIESGAQLFSVDASEIGNTDELLAQAREQLVDLAFQGQIQSMQFAEEKIEIEQKHKELEKRNQLLESEVVRDSLTGVFTRRYFDEIFLKEITRCGRQGFGAAVLFCDIDNFKFINDNYGHPAGDQVLIKTAVAIQDSIRTCDTLARYGGEEFVVLLVDVDPEKVLEIGERIRTNIEAMQIHISPTIQADNGSDSLNQAESTAEASSKTGRSTFGVTVSVGGCLASPVDSAAGSEDCQKMLAIADQKMYHVKRSGKNGVKIQQYLEPQVVRS